MLIHRSNLTGATALKLAHTAIDMAKTRDLNICVAVIGAAGELLVFLRSDDVIFAAETLCQQKAKTALRFRKSTQGLFERTLECGFLKAGFSNQPDIMLIPGGFPVFEQGECIGAIGISGAMAEEDADIALQAITQVGLSANK